MPTLHNREREMDYRGNRQEDREISLGTGTILGIFFALALLCAVFFGLGYSMGRKSAQPSAIVPAAAVDVTPSGNVFSSFKPSASQASQPRPSAQSQEPPVDPDATIVTTPVTNSESVSERPRQTTQPHSQPVVPNDAPQAVPVRQPSRSAATAPASLAAMPATNPNGTTMVQIAAVSHQEDADVLLAALKKRGYAVFVRNEPQDRLLHVQVGPFSSKKDADAMRQRLLSDGYNAIVK